MPPAPDQEAGAPGAIMRVPPMPGRRTLLALLLAAAAIPLGYAAGQDYVEAAAFVIRAAGMEGLARRLAQLEAEPVSERSLTVPWRDGVLQAREYLPADVENRPILLVPGVHAAGVDEPRLMTFARELAAAGHPVLTIASPDLAAYRITPATTLMIVDAAQWLRAEWRGRLPDARGDVGLMGISFGGGLAVVAASRLDEGIAWVLSLGGHGDLPRTLRFLTTGALPDGSTAAPPHDYGVAVILLGLADRVVPAPQVEPLRGGIRQFLAASHTDVVDKAAGARAFAGARALADTLPEPARTYLTWVNDRRVEKLGPLLLPHLQALGDDPALSPARNPPPRAPVYLLHGTGDTVIPAAESELLAQRLRGAGADVELLSTPLITHAEVDRPPSLPEIWKLIRFWAGPL